MEFPALSAFFGDADFFAPKYFYSAAEKQEIITYYYDLLPNGVVALSDWLQASLHLVLLLAYAVAAFMLILKRDKTNSVLLKRFSILMAILAFTEILLQAGFLLTGASAITAEIVLAGLMAITVLLLGYWIVDIKQVLPVLEGKKYKTSPLSQQQALLIEKKIHNFLVKEENYLDPNLKVADLADGLQIPSHHISQVLSERMNTNFYSIINNYRIEKAKELLASGALEKISVQAVGEECGFSSKTSFYRAFKKVTGMTPAQYQSYQIS